MFHLGIYYGTPAFGAVDADLAAVTDPFLTVSNNHLILPTAMYLQGAYALGAALSRVKVVTPKLRATSYYSIRGIEESLTPLTNPNFDEIFWNPVVLNPIDETQALATNTAGSSTDPETVGLWFGDMQRALPAGEMYTVRWTQPSTPGAAVWTQQSVVMDQVLPGGTYAIVGMEVVCTGAQWARIIFPSTTPRPGVICSQTVGFRNSRYFRYGLLGEFGRFQSIAQPLVEVWSQAGASTSVQGWWDIIRLA